MQQQEDKLHLRQHERAVKNERKKAEADEEQSRLKLELTNGSSKASGSVAEDIANIGSRRNHKKTARWVQSVAHRSVPRPPLSPNVVTDPTANVTQNRVDKSITLTKNYPAVPTG